MNTAGRKTISHELPPWVDPGASNYFITICCLERGPNHLCTPAVGEAILSTVRFYHERRRWFPSLFLLMPDQLHMLVSFGREQTMEKVVRDWKRYTARAHGIDWQRDFFEHRLRHDEIADEKATYILLNPVRAGLIDEGADWPYALMLD